MKHSWLRHTRFGFALETALRHTRHVVPALPHFQLPVRGESQMALVHRGLSTIKARPGLPLSEFTKGHPDTETLKHGMADEVESALQKGRPLEALSSAWHLAASDMTDGTAFEVHLELCRIVHADAIEAARQALGAQVVMHVSCLDRLDRALSSVRSFAAAESAGVSQLVVVGSSNADRFRFDLAQRTLIVPTRDDYESLPSKVMAAFFFLGLVGGIDGLLKVDDDHRLHDPSELRRAFDRLKHAKPLQIGVLTRVRELGRHPRAWHFGKCAQPDVNKALFTLPGTTRWANGSNGYLLNGKALALLLWSRVYFPDYIRLGLYEDMVVSDLIERQGGRLGVTDTSRFLYDVAQY